MQHDETTTNDAYDPQDDGDYEALDAWLSSYDDDRALGESASSVETKTECAGRATALRDKCRLQERVSWRQKITLMSDGLSLQDDKSLLGQEQTEKALEHARALREKQQAEMFDIIAEMREIKEREQQANSETASTGSTLKGVLQSGGTPVEDAVIIRFDPKAGELVVSSLDSGTTVGDFFKDRICSLSLDDAERHLFRYLSRPNSDEYQRTILALRRRIAFLRIRQLKRLITQIKSRLRVTARPPRIRYSGGVFRYRIALLGLTPTGSQTQNSDIVAGPTSPLTQHKMIGTLHVKTHPRTSSDPCAQWRASGREHTRAHARRCGRIAPYGAACARRFDPARHGIFGPDQGNHNAQTSLHDQAQVRVRLDAHLVRANRDQHAIVGA